MPAGFLGQPEKNHVRQDDQNEGATSLRSSVLVSTLTPSSGSTRQAIQATSDDIKKACASMIWFEPSSNDDDNFNDNNHGPSGGDDAAAQQQNTKASAPRVAPPTDDDVVEPALVVEEKPAASRKKSHNNNNDNKNINNNNNGNAVLRAFKSLVPKPMKKAVQKRVRIAVPHATETTPLVSSSSSSSKKASRPTVGDSTIITQQRQPQPFDFSGLEHDSGGVYMPDENPRRLELRQRAQAGWRRIAAEVRSGDMLLRAAAMNPLRDKMSMDEKERERQRAQALIRKGVEFNLWQCTLAVLFYIGIAIFAFSFVFGHWTIIDSIYFAIVTFTTIGYGDLVPDSYVSRIFTCFFALSGVACLGIAVGVIGTNVIEAQEAAVEKTTKLAQNRVMGLFSSTQKPTVVVKDETKEENAVVAAISRTNMNYLWQLFFHFSLVLFILVIFAFAVANDPGIDAKWDIFDAFYYTIITASTVGYGDFAPRTQLGRLLAIFFIPLSVGAMGHFLSSVASIIMESRRSSFQKKMDQHELSLQDLEIMDEDGDGQVTRAEFLEFMLIAMNKVDKEFIDEIRQSFARLDADNTGSLSKEDLVAAARSKLQSCPKKLELSNYRQQLLLQAERHRRARKQEMAAGRNRSRTGSFWEDNFAFVNKVFAKDEIEKSMEGNNYNDSSNQTHPLLS